MSDATKAAGRWRFSYSVFLPIFLATMTALGVVGLFVSFSMHKNDELSAERQSKLVAHVLDEQRDKVADEQRDVAAWDEAVQAAGEETDLGWLDDNVGYGLFEYFGHDKSYVLNGRLQPIYASSNGRRSDPKTYENDRATIEPLAQKLKEIDWQGALLAYISGQSTKVPNVADIAMIGGQPAIVSLVPIVSDSGDIEQAPGAEALQVSIQYLDGIMAKTVSDQLLLGSGRFTLSLALGKDEISLPVKNDAGWTVVNFAWIPDRPGAHLIVETGPIVGSAVSVIFGIILVLVLRLKSTTSQIEAERAAAQHQAFHDALTGLGNRVTFENGLVEALAAGPEEKAQVAVLLLDLDRFKQVNDTLGHAAGDELIRQVGKRLKPLVRVTDTLSRLGGDEFGIVARNVTSAADVAALSQRIIGAIRTPFELKEGLANVGISVGIAMTPDQSLGSAELTRQADIALYEAKDGGRNRYELFQDHMNAELHRRQKIENDLRTALETGTELDVRFEPLVRADGGDLLGVEAVLVWRHASEGIIEADDFIAIAESCGLAEAVGEFALRRACEAGSHSEVALVSVQVFPSQLRNPGFFERAFTIITETKISPARLELGVNEQMLSGAEQIANNNLRKLRQAGVKIAIADFGKGLASLKLLQQFQIDRIRIERSLIDDLAQSANPESITEAVVGLGRAIGVEVTASGVVTPAEKEFLTRMGCLSFQGPLFQPEGQSLQLRLVADGGILAEDNGAVTDAPDSSAPHNENQDNLPDTGT